MIVKELIEQCPVETVVSEVLTLCCVDENEQTSVRGSYTAFVENLSCGNRASAFRNKRYRGNQRKD